MLPAVAGRLSRSILRVPAFNKGHALTRVTGAGFHSGRARLMTNYHPTAQHKDEPGNSVKDAWDFSEENYKRVDMILHRYPTNYKAAGIIPLLDLAQRQNGGWLPVAAMDKVASIVGVVPMRVYEVATFYTMFNREKVGKYFIQLCGTTPCMVNGAEEIRATIEKHLGIKEGETSKDGLFTLREVECLGSCANAPMVQLNDDYYECLTPASTIELLEACKKGNPPKMGRWGSLPMNGQVSCEGPHGKTTLKEPAPAPGFMMRKDLDGNVDPATVKRDMHY
ncbi:nadh dehydrogenase [Nannochloropsis gaditana]|uniref:Nadh dehydrogenase n=1 Tax=Nannochloropsis gaditana TaxID=72520 RepID=W7UB87_9STRA|nr:nadh dehydrogenase [Nannochloropsis gaditana]